ncbi:MAG: TolC family protein [Edaphocola sp.]
MNKSSINKIVAATVLAASLGACKLPSVATKTENNAVPASYNGLQDTANMATINWRSYFTDPYLAALIDTALANNQELNITLQEIQIARNEVRARKGEYLPFVKAGGGAGVDKVARYTNIGAMEANTEIKPGKEMPEPLADYNIGLSANWEVDIWRKLRNAKDAAAKRYLATTEGKNFVVTNLISEVANSYYELLALDNQLAIVNQNIEIQNNALNVVKIQKQAARATELAVKKFEAEVLKTTSYQYGIKQQITETENKINFLLGRFPQPIARRGGGLPDEVPALAQEGVPAQLLENRPDVKQAELNLSAAKLDVKVAKAQFYPSLGITAGVGYRAFNPAYLFNTPKSLLYNLAGDLVAPLINRNAIKATYITANNKQVQAAYDYERTILNAYVEVANQLAKVNNLTNSYDLKLRQVAALAQSIDISNDLFKYARADYMEVLMTQRDALDAKLELVETKRDRLNASVNLYRALGGGWR